MVWRYILAFALSIAVIVVWQSLFPPPRPIAPEPATPAPQAEAPPEAGPERREPERTDLEGEEAPPADEEPPARVHRERRTLELTVERAQLYAESAARGEKAGKPRLRLVADSLGGCIASVALPEFGDKDDRSEPYQLLEVEEATAQKSGGVLFLEISDHEIPRSENWDLKEFADERGAPGVRFRNEIRGLAITKTVSCPDAEIPAAKGEAKLPATGLYHLLATIELENKSDQPKELSYRLFGPLGIDTSATRGGPGTDIYFVAAEWSQRGKGITPKLVAAGSVANGDVSSRLAWVGVSNNYFACLLFPYRDEPGPSGHVAGGFARAYHDPGHIQELIDKGETPHAARDDAYKNVFTGVDSRTLTLEPGESVVHRYGLFMGPRFKEVLATYRPLHFEEVNDYNFLVSFFLALLRFLKGIAFGEWGLAIILMTVLVKICLHPFNKKSQGNMHRFQKQMQKVKPEMDEIKKRYKDNRLKQNQEMQRLFKEKGINPGQQMGGCLLILLQLPIWFALYSTLGYSLGLRQAEFLWIEDLTLPDRLFPLGFRAFGGMFMHFNLLPILYVIFTIVNQRLQPKPEDPQMRSQYQMMTFMMVFFGFIFYNFPAGFMLYIMTSTFLGIFESKMIKSELAREEAAQGGGAAPGGGVQVAAGGPMYGGKGAGGGGGGSRSSGGGGRSGASSKKRGKGRKRAKGKR